MAHLVVNGLASVAYVENPQTPFPLLGPFHQQTLCSRLTDLSLIEVSTCPTPYNHAGASSKVLKPNFCPLATLMLNTRPPHTACGESSSLRAVKYSSPPTPSLLPGASLSCAHNMPPTTQPLLSRQPHHTEWTLFKLSRSLDWLRQFFP